VAQKLKAKRKAEAKAAGPAMKTHLETLQFIRNGKTLVEIAHLRELTEGTIASHIAMLFEERQLTDVSPYLTPEQQAQLAEKLEANAADGSLTALHEATGKNLSFEQLRIGIAWWRNKKRWF